MFKRNNYKFNSLFFVLLAVVVLGLFLYLSKNNNKNTDSKGNTTIKDGVFMIVNNHIIESRLIDENLYLVVIPSFSNSINSKLYYNGQELNDYFYYIDKDYEVDEIKIRLIKLEDTKTIFIDVDSQTGIDYDTADVDARYKIYDESNKLVYATKGADKLSVRGNTTAYNYKRPFTIELYRKIELSNITKSKKFTLLANAYDKSNLRNKLVYDLAIETGLSGTPNLEYINVYFNNNYEGLYTISNNLIKESELSIINNKNDVLFAVESYIEKGEIITTPNGVDIRIRYPKNKSEKSIKVIERFEEKINSITKDYWPDELDMESFVNKYLIDEVFGNYEADYRSSYYYYKSTEDKYYAGPIWDYDLSMSNPVIDDKYHKRYDIDYGKYRGKYYKHFLDNDLFNKKIKTYYQETYLEQIDSKIPQKIADINNKYKNSIKANNLNWDWMYCDLVTEDIDPIYYGNFNTTEQLLDFLKNREEYLNLLWLSQ